MKNTIILITLVLFTSFSFSQTEQINNKSITNNFVQKLNSSDFKGILELSEIEKRDMVLRVCDAFEMAISLGDDSLIALKKQILIELNLPEDVEESSIVVAQFLNKYKDILICPESDTTNIYKNEHIYKRAVSRSRFIIFYGFLLNNALKIDFNMVEIRSGRKETLLDFIQAKVDGKNISQGFIDELNALIIQLQNYGAKYYSEL